MPATTDDFLKINYAMMRRKNTRQWQNQPGNPTAAACGVVRKSKLRKLLASLKDYKIC